MRPLSTYPTSVVFIGCFALAGGLALAEPSFAQSQNTEHTLELDEGSESPPATIEDVAWLAGAWGGAGLGGRVEEGWMPPSAGAMLGSFKLIQNDEPAFYEFLIIVEEEGSLVYKVKHFQPDMVGWEEKEDFVPFPLVRLGEGEVYFAGLTYIRDGDEGLTVYLSMTRDGEQQEVEFNFRRAGSESGR